MQRGFMGILYSKTNDPCQGALNATKDVLQGDLSKCGAVKKLLNECISQENFVTNLQESGMELLGCKQEEPVSTNIRRTASCFNMEGFKRCVNESHIDISKSVLSKEECGSYTSSISKCIEKSGKHVNPPSRGKESIVGFFSVYGCGQEHGGIPAGKPTGRNSSPSLASSLTMTLSAA
ncbi:hypothetical protein HPB50_028049 [Hyalomma asiaticum]|nr:hypothetical protein HPB50_028049 [Hyalomma asiaticum]